MAYLVRFIILGILAAITAAATATGAYWPGYLVGTGLLAFVPGAWLIEIIPDVLEAVIEAALD